MRISDWSSDVCSSDLRQVFLKQVERQSCGTLADGKLARRMASIHTPSRQPGAFRDELDEVRLTSNERVDLQLQKKVVVYGRSEARRVGKECVRACRSR